MGLAGVGGPRPDHCLQPSPSWTPFLANPGSPWPGASFTVGGQLAGHLRLDNRGSRHCVARLDRAAVHSPQSIDRDVVCPFGWPRCGGSGHRGWSRLLRRHGNPSQTEGGLQQRLLELPFPLMLALSCGCQLLSPEDGFLYARALNQLRQAGIEGTERFGAIMLLWLISSSLMILPLVLLGAMGAMRTGSFLEPIQRGLVDHGAEFGAILSLGLASYLGWQGWIAMQAMG